jgi:hypothetical protein
MRVISTCHKAGWDVYGKRWLEGLKHWPKETEFILYTEGFDLDHPLVLSKRVEDLPRAQAFKAKYAHYTPFAWRWDIVKWSNKVFAAYDALYDYEGLALWLDADCMTLQDIPAGYIEGMLPPGDFWAGFKRTGWQTETGFWIMDCWHRERRRFLDTWIQWLESGSFKNLEQWCDASTLDATIRAFTRDGLIEVASLSGEFEKEEHPMSKVELSKYINHLKGALKNVEEP